jgi:hypothetical protein
VFFETAGEGYGEDTYLLVPSLFVALFVALVSGVNRLQRSEQLNFHLV